MGPGPKVVADHLHPARQRLPQEAFQAPREELAPVAALVAGDPRVEVKSSSALLVPDASPGDRQSKPFVQLTGKILERPRGLLC